MASGGGDTQPDPKFRHEVRQFHAIDAIGNVLYFVGEICVHNLFNMEGLLGELESPISGKTSKKVVFLKEKKRKQNFKNYSYIGNIFTKYENNKHY